MPNWCFTRVCFKGKPDNINRLRSDIAKATEWGYRNPLWCNIRYFLSLSGFDAVSYEQRMINKYIPQMHDCNFRGNVFDTYLQSEECGEYLLYYPSFETAWWMDYGLLQIISINYNVEFSAYSDEPGMGYYGKCKNGSIDTYDYDYRIIPNYEQLEEAVENNPELEIDYDIPVKIGDSNIESIIEELKKHNIEYNIGHIEEEEAPKIYGIYYHYKYGVCYDDEIHNKIYNYPELDPFNINIT